MPDSALSGGDVVLVTIVLAVSLAALAFAAYLVRAVMAADQGTPTMREIAQAVQEGAAGYLRRQVKTLGVFAGVVFLLLLGLPVHRSEEHTSELQSRPYLGCRFLLEK